MPRTAIVVEECTRFTNGFQPNWVAFDEANGMEYANASGDAIPMVRTTGGANRTVTAISKDGTDTDLAVSDRPHDCPVDDITFLAKHAGQYYNQTGNLVYLDINVGGGAGTEIAVVRFL